MPYHHECPDGCTTVPSYLGSSHFQLGSGINTQKCLVDKISAEIYPKIFGGVSKKSKIRDFEHFFLVL